MVFRQRLRLAARPVEGDQLLRAEAFPQRVARDEHFEFGDELGVAAAIEVCVDPGLQAGEIQLVEPGGFGPRERLLKLGQWLSAPERKRLAEQLRRECGVPGCVCCFAFEPQALEPDGVDRRGIDLDRVPRRPCADQLPRQHFAQLRDIDLHHLLRRLGNLLAPEVVH